jgi:tetratricopeptide (TPR) repeat protein
MREPVSVRAGRWARRHRPLVAGVAAAAVMALVGLATATFLLTRMNEQERRARQAVEEQRDVADEQRAQADRSFRQARDAVARYLTLAAENPRLKEAGLVKVRKSLLGGAEPFLRQFIAERQDDPQGRADLATAYHLYGTVALETADFKEAVDRLEKAIALRKDLPQSESNEMGAELEIIQSLNSLGSAYQSLGRFEKAEQSFAESCSRAARYAKALPNKPERNRKWAESLSELASAQRALGRFDHAEKSYRTSMELLETLHASNPKNEANQDSLAGTYHKLAWYYHGIRNNFPLAFQFYKKARKLREDLAKSPSPEQADRQQNLAMTLNNMSNLYLQSGDLDQAEKLVQMVKHIRQRLVDRHPERTQFKNTLAYSYYGLAEIAHVRRRYAEAEQGYKTYIGLRRQLHESFPDAVDFKESLADSLRLLGRFYRHANKLEKAEAPILEAQGLLKQLVHDHPLIPKFEETLASTCLNLGMLYGDQNHLDKAEIAYEEGIRRFDRLCKGNPKAVNYRVMQAALWANLSNVYKQTNRPDKQGEAIDKCCQLQESVCADSPDSIGDSMYLGLVCVKKSLWLLEHKGHDSDHTQWFERGIKQFRTVAAKAPSNRTAPSHQVNAFAERAALLIKMKEHEQADRDWEEAIRLSPPQGKIDLRASRALEWAQAGRTFQSLEEADKLAVVKKRPPLVSFQLARVFGLAANSEKVEEKRRDECARFAVTMLSKALQGGFFKSAANRKMLEKDVAFEKLKAREDFKQLNAELAKMGAGSDS